MAVKRSISRGGCSKCRERKKKCSQEKPSCSYCTKRNIDCVYPSNQFISYDQNGHKRKSQLTDLLNDPTTTDTTVPPLKKKSLVLYLPTSEIISSSSNIPTVSDGVKTVQIFNEKALLSENFSVSDLALSGYRANLADNNESVDIKSNLALILGNRKVKTSSEDDPQTVYDSPDHINLKIDPEKLRNIIYIEAPAVSEDDFSKFTNLPSFIDKEFADYLFRYYCEYSVCEEEAEENGQYLSFLKICFPLIVGNILVLKCVFILAYLQMMKSKNPQHAQYKNMTPWMDKMYVDSLNELSRRLTYRISVGCDHSLMCVYLLLSIETLKGCRTTMWTRILKLGKSMVTLRGGAQKLLESPTGACLCKLLSMYYTNGISFDSTITPDNSSSGFHSTDLELMMDTTINGLQLYDNRNYFPGVPTDEFLAIVKLYARISNLYFLLEISMKANLSNDHMRYQFVSSWNMNSVLEEAASLDKRLNEMSITPSAFELAFRFARDAGVLYLRQSVFRQVSNSPGTIILVKRMLEYIDQLFDTYTKSGKNEVVFTLPLLILGIDIVAKLDRNWYISRLRRIYDNLSNEMILTVIMLLERVWEINTDGFTLVDWRRLSDEQSLFVTFVGK
ncbi:unnamed protein product [Kuraishia capsulata CBS 1993]|uniref:Zn(2)-C6 fungal-type domain-containing protein n=1 Tax=Kuraishia capsulata CBS 1993 TaxID=1382522 RepID=W6MRW8_9ASCO|nr:uncharacterized protein KUCA_T00003967001 [Kuraishia capsulata CBS 1993]CDK27987.1 unnamed protein product [Kuraishia capsulata CBS 1993]